MSSSKSTICCWASLLVNFRRMVWFMNIWYFEIKALLLDCIFSKVAHGGKLCVNSWLGTKWSFPFLHIPANILPHSFLKMASLCHSDHLTLSLLSLPLLPLHFLFNLLFYYWESPLKPVCSLVHFSQEKCCHPWSIFSVQVEEKLLFLLLLLPSPSPSFLPLSHVCLGQLVRALG